MREEPDIRRRESDRETSSVASGNVLNNVRFRGFTLAELLVTFGVLVLLVLLFTSLLNSAANITTLGQKQMDSDSRARQLLDQMAIDFAQMIKRSDIDYYVKSPSNPQTGGNDQIAFYTAVPGYYATSPSPAPTYTTKSPISLVSYRIYTPAPSPSPCPDCNKMQRMGKGLAWNGFSAAWNPVVFLPQTISAYWAPAVSTSATDSDYEVVGSEAFRFEYYYLLKNGTLSDTPWDTGAGHTSVTGMQDVAAIVADIAVIDPKSKVLLTDAQIATLAAGLSDYTSGMVPGQLRASWQTYLNGITSLPGPAISGVRLYERYFYLSPPTL
jgi:type II secretory pathway pseudopilin PulG